MTSNYYAKVSSTGRVEQISNTNGYTLTGLAQITESEYALLSGGLEKYYFIGSILHAKPPQPSLVYSFDYTTKEWVVDLALAKKTAIYKRNSLLASSDWTQLPDVPLVTKTVWAVYRQALRDITDQVGYPLNIEWPVLQQ